jgi:beta-glucanase (GH16 family)
MSIHQNPFNNRKEKIMNKTIHFYAGLFLTCLCCFALVLTSGCGVGSGAGQEGGEPATSRVTPVAQAQAKFEYTEANYASKNFDASLCSFVDKFEGNKLDLTKWGYQNGNGSQYGINGWGNNERQAYATENVVVENGTLRLIAKAEKKYDRDYTSGKIVTANSRGNASIGEPEEGKGTKFAQKYGRFEAKIRLVTPVKGLWPAFWMMPVNNTYGGWPRSG